MSPRLPSPPMGSISSPEVVTIRPNYGTFRARKSRPLADIVPMSTSVAFSPDGQYILTGSLDHTAKLWDLQGQEVQAFSGHSSYVYSVAFSPDGQYILTGSSDKTAKLWDLQGQEVRAFSGHSSEVTSVAFSPDGQYILTGSRDGYGQIMGP